MQLGDALKRVGATIAKEKIEEAVATLYIRVDLDQGERWVEAMTEFMLVAASKEIQLDVSKYFYVASGSVRYLWRIVITGAVNTALSLFGSCALAVAMAHTPEINSFPLVGRVKYEFNPAKGKIKGGHEHDQALGIINMAVGGVTGVA